LNAPGEDDDMSGRVRFHGLKVSRPNAKIARYTAIKHDPQEPNPDRVKLLKTGRYVYKTDGLTNLNYSVEHVTINRLYTDIKARLLMSLTLKKKVEVEHDMKRTRY